ncbi:hypothetical protein LINPERHAP1_LOCUS14575 [Linum perenne]
MMAWRRCLERDVQLARGS